MKVIICVLALLAIVAFIFICGPALLHVPLIVVEMVDVINFLIQLQVERWKETIAMLREVLFGDGED